MPEVKVDELKLAKDIKERIYRGEKYYTFDEMLIIKLTNIERLLNEIKDKKE